MVREHNYSTVADRGGEAPTPSQTLASMAPGRPLESLPLAVMRLPASVRYVILRRAYEAAHALTICVPNRLN